MAGDLAATSVRLTAAKKAVADLQRLCSVCTTAYLRDEGAFFVNEAVNVIKLIEEVIEDKAAAPSSHLSDENVNNALLKTEDVLRALADRIAAANRQPEPRNIFIKIVRQLSNPHRQIFKDARKLLGQVLPGMAEAAHTGPECTLETPTGSAGMGPSDPTGGSTPSTLSVGSEGTRPHHVIDSSELVLKEVIGSGPEGKVYRGTWGNIDIAAKEYLIEDGDAVHGHSAAPGESSSLASMREALDAWSKDMALLMCFNHPNLVRICGVCLDPPLVVMEYHRHGSVFEMIQKARGQWVSTHARAGAPSTRQATQYMDYLTWDRRLEMLHDVAAGLMYLHLRHYPHGDLRSQNLFPGRHGRVKISGLGMRGRHRSMQAKLESGVEYYSLSHVAPEVLTGRPASIASDVYSFGIIMYELLTWQMPFHDLSQEQVAFQVLGSFRPDIPAEEHLPPGTSSSTLLSSYIKLMKECWDQEPARRPSFDKIAARLKAMIRWRLAIQRHPTLAGVANKLRADAAVSSRGTSTPPPAILAGTGALSHKDAARPAAAGTPATMQDLPSTQVRASEVVPAVESPFASSFSASGGVVRTAHGGEEEGQELLPSPESSLVHPYLSSLEQQHQRWPLQYQGWYEAHARAQRAAAQSAVMRSSGARRDVKVMQAAASDVVPAEDPPFCSSLRELSKGADQVDVGHGEPLSGPEHLASGAKLPQLQPQLLYLRLQAPSSGQQPQLPWLQQQQWQQAALPSPTEAASASTPASDLGHAPSMPACDGRTDPPQQRHTSYAVEKQLHLGLPGLNAVLARRNSNGRQVLLLQLHLRQRLQPSRQAQLLQELHGAVKQRHPHVLQLQDARLSRGCLSCVTEPCSTSLVQYIQQRGGRLSEGLSRWLFQQLVLGVDYCHRQGVAGIPVQHSLLQVVPNLPQPVLKVIPIPFWSPQPKAAPALGLQERIADDLQQCGLLLVTMLGGTVANVAGQQLQDVQHRVPEGVSRACQLFVADLLQQRRKRLPTAASILWHPWVKQNLPRAALELHESCLAQAWQLQQGRAATAVSLNSSVTSVLQQLQQDLLFLQQQLQSCARAAKQLPQAGLMPWIVRHSLYGVGAACTAVLQALSMLQQGVVRSAGRRSRRTPLGPLVNHLQLVNLQKALSTVSNSVEDFSQQLQLHPPPTQQWRQQQQQRGQQQKAAARQLLASLLSSWRVFFAAERAAADARRCRATANQVVVAFLCPAHPRLPRPPKLVQQQQTTSVDLVQPLVSLGLLQVMIQHAWPVHCNTGTAAVGLWSLMLQLPGNAGIYTAAAAHDSTEGSLAVNEQMQQLPAELLILQQERVTADGLSIALYAAQQGPQQLWIAGLQLQPVCVGAQADSWQCSQQQQQEQKQAAGKLPLMLRAQQQQQPCSLQQYQPLLKLLRHLPVSHVANEEQFSGAHPGTTKLPTAVSSSHASTDKSTAGAFSTLVGLCCSPPLLLMQQPPGGTLECWLQKQQQLLQNAAGSSSSKVSMQWTRLAPWQLLLQLLTEVAEALCIMHEQAYLAAHGHVHAGAVFLQQPLPDIGTGAGQQQQVPPGQRLSQLSLIGPWQQVASSARTFRPCITAGEVLLTAAPVSPATDVYSFGMLMLQLATCWVPQQHEPGSDQQLAEMRWCHKMLERTGSTFPLTDKAVAVAAEVAESSWDLESSDVMQWLPQLPPAGTLLPTGRVYYLPAGYTELMRECCCVDATARPTAQHLLQRLSALAA